VGQSAMKRKARTAVAEGAYVENATHDKKMFKKNASY
jgi:hypothetical protein